MNYKNNNIAERVVGSFASSVKVRSLTALVILCGLTVSSVEAATVTYKDETPDPITTLNYTGAEDTHLIEAFNDPRNQNFGARTDMSIGNGGVNAFGRAHALVRFDVSSLAGQFASIDAAKVRLYYAGTPSLSAGSFSAYQVSAANTGWVEGPGAGSVASNQFPGSSTWAERLRGTQGSNGTPNGTPWASGTHVWPTNGGLSIPPTDHISSAIATAAFTGTELATTSVDLVLNNMSAVVDWINGTNSGLVLKPDTPTDLGGVKWYTSEAIGLGAGFAQYHPELIIDYTAIPEPASLTLLVMSSLALLCGRRK